MITRSNLLTRIVRLVTGALSQRAALARIRLQDSGSKVIESSEQSLLRRRVQASAAALLVAKAAFTIRSLLLSGSPATMDAAVLLSLLAVSLWLYVPRNVPVYWLRFAEVLIFLGMSLQLGVQLHQDLRNYSTLPTTTAEETSRAAVSFVAAVKDQIIATFGLMMIYGMLIPNTARRAALMVFLMAITPGIVIGMNESSRQVINRFRVEHVGSPVVFSGNLLALVIGASAAIYGTAVMNRWRTRALEAEQLGQYRLGTRIGSGGMGDVYLAEHRLLRRVCAVKLIRADLSDDPVILKRFEREVQTTATLTHWNTVEIYDYGQMVDGTFFYVMEHLHGKNLKEIVIETGPLRETRVIFILRQVCNALREAAIRNLVHRDIKPSNIFLAHLGERFDVVKLLDFGLVRTLASVKDPGVSVVNEIKGSPRYMCPEQAQGRVPDTRGDLYSLGAVAFFLLTGRPPFNLENALELVVAHATYPPPKLSECGVKVGAELEAVITTCLQKKPEDRFQSPDELLAILDSLAETTAWTWQSAEHWWKDHFPDFVRKERRVDHPPATPGHSGPETHGDSALEKTVIDSR